MAFRCRSDVVPVQLRHARRDGNFSMERPQNEIVSRSVIVLFGSV